jgi:hypothetical protein
MTRHKIDWPHDLAWFLNRPSRHERVDGRETAKRRIVPPRRSGGLTLRADWIGCEAIARALSGMTTRCVAAAGWIGRNGSSTIGVQGPARAGDACSLCRLTGRQRGNRKPGTPGHAERLDTLRTRRQMRARTAGCLRTMQDALGAGRPWAKLVRTWLARSGHRIKFRFAWAAARTCIRPHAHPIEQLCSLMHGHNTPNQCHGRFADVCRCELDMPACASAQEPAYPFLYRTEISSAGVTRPFADARINKTTIGGERQLFCTEWALMQCRGRRHHQVREGFLVNESNKE